MGIKRAATDTIEVTKKQKVTSSFKLTLAEFGYAVVRVTLPKTLSELRVDIATEIANFPEFKGGAQETVLGGFAAYGNPGSYHNTTVRSIRSAIHPTIHALLSEGEPDRGVEQIIDRLMVRKVGNSPSKEAWHRDICPHQLFGDTIYGGWVNLDDTEQIFSCVPGTHTTTHKQGATGFATIHKDEHKAYKEKSVRVKIPAGHVLVFNENLVHEVFPSKAKYDMYRLFTGWRLTHSDGPLCVDLLKQLRTQAPITLKSGQEPPMYAILHWVNSRKNLEKFSKGVVDRCTETRTVGSGNHKGDEHRVVHRFMRSLEEYGFKRYPPYTLAELIIHHPF